MSVEEQCKEQISRGILPEERSVKELCEKLREVLAFEPNVVTVEGPVTLVGNLHGQLTDLQEIFAVSGGCPDTNYLFMGDFADYGTQGIEVIVMLFSLKLKYPNRVTLLRGEHESRAISAIYGLQLECQRKYGSTQLWEAFCSTFDFLPFAAIVSTASSALPLGGKAATTETGSKTVASGDLFVVHGGITADVMSVDGLRVLERFGEIPKTGPLSDVFWSDPQDRDGVKPSGRGVGHLWGPDVSRKFLETNGLCGIVRSHQLCMQGWKWSHGEGVVGTVWSAPNFMGQCGNAGATVEIGEVVTPTKFYFNSFLAALYQPTPIVSDFIELSRGIPMYFQ